MIKSDIKYIDSITESSNYYNSEGKVFSIFSNSDYSDDDDDNTPDMKLTRLIPLIKYRRLKYNIKITLKSKSILYYISPLYEGDPCPCPIKRSPVIKNWYQANAYQDKLKIK